MRTAVVAIAFAFAAVPAAAEKPDPIVTPLAAAGAALAGGMVGSGVALSLAFAAQQTTTDEVTAENRTLNQLATFGTLTMPGLLSVAGAIVGGSATGGTVGGLTAGFGATVGAAAGTAAALVAIPLTPTTATSSPIVATAAVAGVVIAGAAVGGAVGAVIGALSASEPEEAADDVAEDASERDDAANNEFTLDEKTESP